MENINNVYLLFYKENPCEYNECLDLELNRIPIINFYRNNIKPFNKNFHHFITEMAFQLHWYYKKYKNTKILIKPNKFVNE